MTHHPKHIKFKGERYALKKRHGLLSDQDATKLVDTICNVSGKLCEEGYIAQDMDTIADEFEERGFEKVDQATVKQFLKTPGVFDWLTAKGAGAMRTSKTRKRVASLPNFDLPKLLTQVHTELAKINYEYEEDLVSDACLWISQYLSEDLSAREVEESSETQNRAVFEFDTDIRPSLFKLLGVDSTEELKNHAHESFAHSWEDNIQTKREEMARWRQEERERLEDRGEYLYEQKRDRELEGW